MNKFYNRFLLASKLLSLAMHGGELREFISLLSEGFFFADTLLFFLDCHMQSKSISTEYKDGKITVTFEMDNIRMSKLQSHSKWNDNGG